MENNSNFDVFISFKDTDSDNNRTKSSLRAEDFYYSLRSNGANPFFSREILRGCGGNEFRPRINAALESARVMVLIFDNVDYLREDWVKHEWDYFLTHKKMIIPVFMDIDSADWKRVPPAISELQGYDLTNDNSMFRYTEALEAVSKALREPATASRRRPDADPSMDRRGYGYDTSGSGRGAGNIGFDSLVDGAKTLLGGVSSRLGNVRDNAAKNFNADRLWDGWDKLVNSVRANRKKIIIACASVLGAIIVISAIGKLPGMIKKCTAQVLRPGYEHLEGVKDAEGNTVIPIEYSDDSEECISGRVSGSISQGLEDVYYFESKNPGIYYFLIDERTSNYDVYATVYDANDNYVFNMTNEERALIKTQGKYKVVVTSNSEEECKYFLNIYVPNEAVTLTKEEPLVHGTLAYKYQENTYMFAAPVSGRYRVDCLNRTNGVNVIVEVYDANNHSVIRETNGGHMELQQGSLYTIYAEYESDLCEYDLRISIPDEIVAMTDSGIENAKISFANQINKYTYKAPISGKYRFECNDRTNGYHVQLRVYDSNNKLIIWEANQGTVDLQKDMQYRVEVEYEKELCSYSIFVGVPNKTVVIDPSNAVVSGKISYIDQVNTYTYIPAETGRYRIAATDRTNDYNVELLMYDANSRLILSATNDGEIDLTAGTLYTICAKYNKNLCDYTLRVSH